MFELTIDPRFAESDALGHISNTTFPVWFEAARDPLFRIFHPAMTVHDWPLILARMEVDYLAQTYLGSPVTIHTYLSRLGNSSFEVIHEASQNGKPVARGKAVMVHFNYQTERAEPIPAPVRSALLPHMRGE